MRRSFERCMGFSAVMIMATQAMAQSASWPTNWTGLYVGLDAGYTWGKSSTSTSLVPAPNSGGNFNFAPSVISDAASIHAGDLRASSPVGGAHVGFNMQSGAIVFGAELDVQALDIGAARISSRPLTCCAPDVMEVGSTINLDWLATARARFGFTSGQFLYFLSGGVAVSEMHASFTFAELSTPIRGSTRAAETRWGWTVGGGLEYALDRNWTLKSDYLFIDLGSVSAPPGRLVGTVFATPRSAVVGNADVFLHVARAGINYKF